MDTANANRESRGESELRRKNRGRSGKRDFRRNSMTRRFAIIPLDARAFKIIKERELVKNLPGGSSALDVFEL